MGDLTQFEFTQQGYRQLVRAIREALPQPDPETATAPLRAELPQLVVDGEAAYFDPQGHIRWVQPNRSSEVPRTWRPLLVGEARA